MTNAELGKIHKQVEGVYLTIVLTDGTMVQGVGFSVKSYQQEVALYQGVLRFKAETILAIWATGSEGRIRITK